MLRLIGRSVLVVMGCALVSLGFPACDVEQPGDELARDIDEEEDAEDPASVRPTGADELTAEPDAMEANYFVPVGTHDEANCDVLEGWVRDGDTNSPSWVTIYRNAPFPYGQYVSTAYANLYRGDLPFADKNHGFSIATPNAFKTGNDETVYIHGINIDTSGNWGTPGVTNPLLSSTGVTICCGTCDGGDEDDDGPGPETTF